VTVLAAFAEDTAPTSYQQQEDHAYAEGQYDENVYSGVTDAAAPHADQGMCARALYDYQAGLSFLSFLSLWHRCGFAFSSLDLQ